MCLLIYDLIYGNLLYKLGYYNEVRTPAAAGGGILLEDWLCAYLVSRITIYHLP